MSTPADPTPKPRRRYDGTRRRARAQATRRAIADAARELFEEDGWAGTTMRAVAARAGVAEPTIYAAYANKAGLALALVEAIEDDADRAATEAELDAARGDAARQLTALIAFDRRLFEHSGDLITLLIDAGRAEPGLARAYRQGRDTGDRVRREVFTSWGTGVLVAGVTLDEALDAYAAICNIHAYQILRHERGYPPAQIQTWWTQTLSRLLLASD